MSMLITLNTRHSIHQRRKRQEGDSHQLPIFLPGSLDRQKHPFTSRFPMSQNRQHTEPTSTQVSVNVERTVHFDFDGGTIEDQHVDCEAQVIGDETEDKSSLSI